MYPFFKERIAYGRRIRERAECLLDTHGERARAEALLAADEPGIPEAERSFWHAVAARLARLAAAGRGAGRLAA